MNLSESHKEALWRLYVRRTEREESLFRRAFRRVLLKQRDEVIVNLISARTVEEALFDYKEAIRDFKNGFQSVIQHTVIEGVRQAIDLVEILKQFGAEFLNPHSLAWIETDSLKLAKGVNKTTRAQLRRSLAEGFSAGEGIPKLSARVSSLYSQKYSRHAHTVARTETIRASNFGALQGYKDAGVEMVEFYVSLDESTCEECEVLSGKHFTPSEAEGLIPVHPNCRCTYLPVIPKEVERRPPVTGEASPELQNLIDNKVSTTGRATADKNIGPTLRELKATRLPESHLKTIKSIDFNAAKVGRKGGMAYCDGGNNIVLAAKVGPENVVHEIGHAFWNKRVFVPDKISTVKWDIADVFNASTKSGKGFVSTYAKTNVDEFFAECYTAYAKNPKALSKLNPSMGKIMKQLWKW